MPLVSVIIPNYNHARFLTARIESVINQRFQDFEVILMDDCSTDGSLDIIEGYRHHPKVSRVMLNTRNGGSTFLQWEKGINAAQGKYIWIAESDDDADEQLLNVLLRPLMENPEIVISFCRSMNMNEQGESTGISLHADALDAVKWTRDYTEHGSAELTNYLQFRNTIPNASAVVFRKPAYLNEMLDTEMKFCGDWLFWKNLLKQEGAKIAYSAQPLNFFREHAQTTRSFSAIVPAREIQRFKEYRAFVPKFFLNPLDDRFRWMMAEWIDRGMEQAFHHTHYQIFPLLHPTLVFRYYLFVVKRFFSPHKKAVLC